MSDDRAELLRFRNYIPRSKKLKEYCTERPTVEALERKLEEDVKNVIEASLQQDVLAQVNPRKPNWDLKRDVHKKLHKLNCQTNVAILQLIRLNIESSTQEDKKAVSAIATATAAKEVDREQNEEEEED